MLTKTAILTAGYYLRVVIILVCIAILSTRSFGKRCYFVNWILRSGVREIPIVYSCLILAVAIHIILELNRTDTSFLPNKTSKLAAYYHHVLLALLHYIKTNKFITSGCRLVWDRE